MIASIISFGFGTFGDPDHIVTHGFVSGIGGGGMLAHSAACRATRLVPLSQ